MREIISRQLQAIQDTWWWRYTEWSEYIKLEEVVYHYNDPQKKNDSEGSSISAEVWRTSGKEDILYVKSQWTVWTRVWRGRLRQVIHDYTWSLISGVNSLKDTVVRSETRNVRIGCVICERLWNPQLWKSDFLLIVSEFSCVWKIIARSKFEGK